MMDDVNRADHYWEIIIIDERFQVESEVVLSALPREQMQYKMTL